MGEAGLNMKLILVSQQLIETNQSGSGGQTTFTSIVFTPVSEQGKVSTTSVTCMYNTKVL